MLPLFFFWSALAHDTRARAARPASSVVTNDDTFWGVPASERSLPHSLKADFLIYYFDPGWKVAFGGSFREPDFLPIRCSK